MARDLNKVMLIWRITQDIEVKKIPNTDRSVVNFSIATNRKYKNAEGKLTEETEFHRCVAFGNVADLIWQYLGKWRRVYIEGMLKTRKWEDTNGVVRYITEIIVNDIIFLDSKPANAEQNVENASEPTIPTDDIPF